MILRVAHTIMRFKALVSSESFIKAVGDNGAIMIVQGRRDVMPATNEPRLVSREDKKELITRLARIEGQIRGIQQMIEREEGSELVAQQMSAARAALNKAYFNLIVRTLEENCLIRTTTDPAIREKMSRLVTILEKYA
jgi:DNA-binding FrmR family transcriptional regulator